MSSNVAPSLISREGLNHRAMLGSSLRAWVCGRGRDGIPVIASINRYLPAIAHLPHLRRPDPYPSGQPSCASSIAEIQMSTAANANLLQQGGAVALWAAALFSGNDLVPCLF